MARLPSSDDRTVVVGRTGSGKTQFGVWLLYTRDWNIRPWIVLDYKGEKTFGKIDPEVLTLDDDLPTEPGIYWVKVNPGEDGKVTELFRKMYYHENIGIFIDETSMLPYQDMWVKACLTQGRSKNIEIIANTQRPVKIDISFFSEASFISIFNISVKDDQKRISDYANGLEIKRLRKYHSLWYDVAEDDYVEFEPVPPPDELIAAFIEAIEEEETAEYVEEKEDKIVKL